MSWVSDAFLLPWCALKFTFLLLWPWALGLSFSCSSTVIRFVTSGYCAHKDLLWPFLALHFRKNTNFQPFLHPPLCNRVVPSSLRLFVGSGKLLGGDGDLERLYYGCGWKCSSCFRYFHGAILILVFISQDHYFRGTSGLFDSLWRCNERTIQVEAQSRVFNDFL